MPIQRVPADVVAHYERVQGYQGDALLAALAAWREVNPGRISESWEQQLPAVSAAVASSQISAAESALVSNGDMRVATGQYTLPDSFLDPESFAGVSSSGGDLDAALYVPAIRAKQSIGRGVSPLVAMRDTRREFEMIVSSLVSDSGRQAAAAGNATRLTGGYTRMLNPPSCSRCAILAGRFYRWNDGFLRHPRCFPEGVVVSGPSADAATRRWYEGELVVLTTASGKNLPLTGNHPVLTSRGWVPANLLEEGDQVVRSTGAEGTSPLVIPDHNQMPALIEDVWRSFRVSGLDRVPTTPEDFHGDGRYGEVDIVRADGSLSSSVYTTLSEHLRKGSLPRGLVESLHFSVEGRANLFGHGDGAAARSSVGRGGLGLPLGRAQVEVAHGSGFAPSASLHASFEKNPRNRPAGDAVLLGESVLRSALEVLVDDQLGGQVGLAPRWDAPGDSFSVETRDGYARVGRDLLHRLSGQVELDRVVEVRRVEFSGHVYSLTSSEGWHDANGLIVSNCDCVHIPVKSNQWAKDEGFIADPYEYFGSLSPEDQAAVFGESNAEAIRDGADISQVVNAGRGRSKDGLSTTASTGRRGVYRGSGPRLTPDAIYERAGGDRDAAKRMLEEYGYALPGGQDPAGALRGQREGYGQMGRGGARVGASRAVEQARATGVRHPTSRATMTAAERRRFDAGASWDAVREGRNPYGRSPLTDEDRRKAEFAYEKYVLGFYGGDPALPTR